MVYFGYALIVTSTMYVLWWFLNAQREATVRQIRGESEAEYNRTVAASLNQNLIELRRIDAQRAISTNPNAQLVVLGGGGGNNNSTMPIVLPPMR